MRGIEPEVIVIDEPEAVPVVRYRYRPASRFPKSAIGVTATVLVHLLISAPMVLGYAAHKSHAPSQDGPGSVSWASQGEESESMILLDLTATTVSSPEDFIEPRIESQGIKLEAPELALVSLDPSPPRDLKKDNAEEAETSNEAAGDPAGTAALFGRYMGQVAARIERAWMRPRSPVDGGMFTCRARISQDHGGNVRSIELQGCGDDERWLQSLRSAILRASPLSAPPEQWLFASNITLNFSAEQYVRGETPEYNYEPAPMAATNVPSHLTLGDASAPKPGESGDYELTIIGKEVHWTRKGSTATTRN